MERYIKSAEGLSLKERIRLGNISSDPKLLAKLAEDKHPDVRYEVAGNIDTPPEVLAKLANDKNFWVLFHVACHPSTPPEALAKLADNDLADKGRVAKHPSTPPKVLAKLANDKEQIVLQGVAENPSATSEGVDFQSID